MKLNLKKVSVMLMLAVATTVSLNSCGEEKAEGDAETTEAAPEGGAEAGAEDEHKCEHGEGDEHKCEHGDAEAGEEKCGGAEGDTTAVEEVAPVEEAPAEVEVPAEEPAH